MYIPDPTKWDGESYCLMTICVPNTDDWIGIVRGKIWELARGRHWNGQTGSIKGAQAVGRLIYKSLCMNCDWQRQTQLQIALMKWLVAAITDRQIHPDSHYLNLDPQNSVTPSNPNPPATEIDRSAFISNGNLADWGLADAVSEAFSKGFIDLPNGVTTVQDDIQGLNEKLDTANDHLDTLHQRFLLNNWIVPDQNIAQILNNTLRVEGDFEDILQSVGKQWGIASVLKAVFTVPDTNLTETWWQSAKSAWDTVFGQPQREFGIAFVLNEVLKRAMIGKTQTGDQPYLDQVAKRLSDDDHHNLYDAINELELISTGTDTSGIESQLMAIVNALESMERAGTKDTETISKALDRVQSAIQAMEIVQINADETARVFYKSNCGCGDVQDLIEGAGGSNNEDEIPDTLPYVPGPIIKDCEPVNVIHFLEWIRDLLQVLDDFLSSYELLNLTIDTVLDVVGDALWARAGLLEVLNQAVGGPGTPEEVVTRPRQAALLIAGALAKLGPLNCLNILAVIIDYIRYDFDILKQLDCNQYQIELDILDFIPLRFGQFLKGKGVSTTLVEDAKALLKALLKTSHGKALL